MAAEAANSLNREAGEKAGRAWTPNERFARVAALSLVFTCAFVVRIHHISDPPLDFHPTRQFRAALLAREYFLRQLPDVPEWRRAMSARNSAERYEFPLLQRAAAIGYGVWGGEDLRIPRLMSVLAWLVGGGLLFVVARKISSWEGALVAAAFFVLHPFGVAASRAFHPDAVMVALLVLTYLALLHFGDHRGVGRATLVALAGGVTVLVKPMALFQVVCGFGAVWLGRRRNGRDRRVLELGVFCLVMVGIAAPYYLREAMSAGTLGGVAGQSFVPRLLLTAGFWRGWIDQIWKVVGFVTPVTALLGYLVLSRGVPKTLLTGLGAGFLAFGAFFSYPVFTHDYYNLQLVPLVALAAAPFAYRVIEGLRKAGFAPGPAPGVVLAIVFAGAVFHLAASSYYERWGTDSSGEAEMYREVGELIGHGSDNVLLANYYAYPLKYYGEVGGTYWPHSFDFWQGRLVGREPEGAVDRLRALRGKHDLRFFIVTNLPELRAQPDLEALLTESYAVFAKDRDFVIYDLTRPRNAEGP